MAFLLFLLTNATLFVRPAELVPSLGDVQLYMVLIAGTLVFAVRRVQHQLSPRTLLQQPVSACVAGVLAAVVLSHMAGGDLGRALDGGVMMAKVALYYVLLVALVNSPQRLRRLLLCTALCSTAMIALSLRDYRAFVAEWAGRADLEEVREQDRHRPPGNPPVLRHIPDRGGLSAEGGQAWMFRLCGLGIFHDPNDLSLLIAVTCVLSAYFLFDRASGPRRWLWLGPLALLVTAYYFTFSRGGVLALGVAGMAWLAARCGGKVAVALGVLGAAALPVALGRHGEISVSSGTGQERIQLWSDGLAQLQSPRLLFGTGAGTYADFAGLVAHNSYVHAFVELGFFGGMAFFGCFFFPAWALYRIRRDGVAIEHPELARMYPYIAALLAGWCMGMTSLSRCYVPPTYMVAGVAAAYLTLVGFWRRRPAPLLVLDQPAVQRLALSSAGLLACCFVFVKVFARWD